MARLLPCPGCERHVRISEALCPFCGEALPLSYQSAGPAPLPQTRLGRAAKFAFGAAVAGAFAVTGCGDDGTAGDTGAADTSTTLDSGGDTGTVGDGGGPDGALDSGGGPLYGGPPDSSAGDGGGDAAMDSGSMALYGGPPVDGGGDGAMVDDGGAVPLYGAPPEA